MRTSVFVALALLAISLLAPLAFAEELRTSASYGAVEFYIDKAEYLPGEPVKFTIVIRNWPDFRERIDIYMYYGEEAVRPLYVYHYPYENDTILFLLKTEGNDSIITFSKAFEESGIYTVRIVIPALNVPATAMYVRFQVGPKYEIVGRVVDENANPVANAVVTVVETGARTVTDENGIFSIYVPNTGTYTLHVTANDFLPTTVEVTVDKLGENDAGIIQIESVAHAITTLREQIASLEDAVNKLASDLEDLSGRVDDVSSRLNELASRVDDLATKLSELADAVAGIDSRVGELAAKLENLAAKLEDLAKAVDERFAKVESSVNDLAKSIEEVKAAYATKDELNTAVSGLEKRIGDLEKRISSVEAALTEKINAIKADVDELKTATIKQLTANVDRLTRSLEDLSRRIESSSNIALIAVILGIIGIVIAVVAVILVYRKIVTA